MKFNSSTEDEIEARRIWPKGVYDFEVIDAEEKLSANKGNPMIEVSLAITAPDGSRRRIRDYLLAQRPEKLLHAATACGVRAKYYAGVLSDEDFIGKRGKLELGVQRSKEYPAKNVVRDYL